MRAICRRSAWHVGRQTQLEEKGQGGWRDMSLESWKSPAKPSWPTRALNLILIMRRKHGGILISLFKD